jgi:uncharacterized protein YeaO (DUF488 family)
MVRIKRAYVPSEPNDGFRVLVDRLWPRGVTKAQAAVDLWAREIAPSTALRKWFAHDPARFGEFAVRYRHELGKDEARGTLQELARRVAHGPVTLVYGARDEVHNGAVVLQDVLQAMARPSGARVPSTRAPRAGEP